MPTTVRLDRKTLGVVRRLAQRWGRTKSEVIRDAIRRLGEAEGASNPPRTAYEALEHAIGCWDSGGARLSEHTGERFAAMLRARHAQATAGREVQGEKGRGRGRTRRRARA